MPCQFRVEQPLCRPILAFSAVSWSEEKYNLFAGMLTRCIWLPVPNKFLVRKNTLHLVVGHSSSRKPAQTLRTLEKGLDEGPYLSLGTMFFPQDYPAQFERIIGRFD